MRAPRKGSALCLTLISWTFLSSCAFSPSTPRCPANPAQQLLDAINEVRAQEGVRPVWPNLLLANAAQAHARALADGEASGHAGLGGSDPLQRIRDAGYLPRAFGENIAMGSPVPRLVVEAWMRSPAHRQVLLDPSVQEVGIGGVLTPDQPIWVAEFGSGREVSETRCHPWHGGPLGAPELCILDYPKEPSTRLHAGAQLFRIDPSAQSGPPGSRRDR